MEIMKAFVCTVVAFLEAREVNFVSATGCSYPPSPLGLSLFAVVMLLIAQIIGCIRSKRIRRAWKSNWKIVVVFYVVSWFTYIIALYFLITGTVLNNQYGQDGYNGIYRGFFAYGAVLAAGCVLLRILYYLTLHKQEKEHKQILVECSNFPKGGFGDQNPP